VGNGAVGSFELVCKRGGERAHSERLKRKIVFSFFFILMKKEAGATSCFCKI
jgi:hypothetical protein